MSKSQLPVKTCLFCGLPFSWRKKWARCWDEVRYCSERCRRSRRTGERHGRQASMPVVPECCDNDDETVPDMVDERHSVCG